MSKLVRDKIPEILVTKGVQAETRILIDDHEYLSALCDKFLEEVREFIEVSASKNHEHIKEELADVMEVINAICKLKKYNLESIEKKREQKQLDKGGFEKRILSIY